MIRASVPLGVMTLPHCEIARLRYLVWRVDVKDEREFASGKQEAQAASEETELCGWAVEQRIFEGQRRWIEDSSSTQ